MAAADGSIIIDVRANTQQATSALTKLAWFPLYVAVRLSVSQ